MNAQTLPERPTGLQVVEAMQAHADEIGVDIEKLVKSISPKSPRTWLKDVQRARFPRPVTVARVKALIAGQALPPKQRYRPQNKSGEKPHRADGADQPRIVRDPCWRCGTRGDLGCAHRPPLEEWTSEMAA